MTTPNPGTNTGWCGTNSPSSYQEDGQQRILKIGRLSPAGGQVYLNVRGSDQVLVAGPNVLNLIPTNQLQWRDLTVLNLDRVPFSRTQVRSTNWEFRPGAATATNRLWKMTRPIEARADTPKINEWLARLQALRVRRLPRDDAPGRTPPPRRAPRRTLQLDLTFLRDASQTNKALELQVGDSPAGPHQPRPGPPPPTPGLIEIDRAPLLPWEGDWINFLDRHLLGLSPVLIGSIEVSGAGLEKFTVQKTADGSWHVHCADGETFPADELLMKDWFFDLTNIQVEIGAPPPPTNPCMAWTTPAVRSCAISSIALRPPARPIRSWPKCSLASAPTSPAAFTKWAATRNTSIPLILNNSTSCPKPAGNCATAPSGISKATKSSPLTFINSAPISATPATANHQWVAPRGYLVTPVQPAIEETLYQMGQLSAIYWSGYGEDHLERFGFDAGRLPHFL